MKTTLLDGALALLGESCNILNKKSVEYIVVGGWSPYLLNSKPIPHPGTRDVDILFKSGANQGELGSIINDFLASDYIMSAKHSFQLLKTKKINGLSFTYNVDLLHPGGQGGSPEMFVDHIDFPIKESLTSNFDYRGQTIVMPRSDLFFNEFIVPYSGVFDLLDGRPVSVEFNLLNEAGLVLSKSQSYLSKKRIRDSFDIFLAISQNSNYEKFIEQIWNIGKYYKEIFASIQEMSYGNNFEIIKQNVLTTCDLHKIKKIQAIDIWTTFNKFFSDLSMPFEGSKVA